MNDLIFIGLTLAFFALAIGYVRFCERIRWTHELREHCHPCNLLPVIDLPRPRVAAPGEVL